MSNTVSNVQSKEAKKQKATSTAPNWTARFHDRDWIVTVTGSRNSQGQVWQCSGKYSRVTSSRLESPVCRIVETHHTGIQASFFTYYFQLPIALLLSKKNITNWWLIDVRTWAGLCFASTVQIRSGEVGCWLSNSPQNNTRLCPSSSISLHLALLVRVCRFVSSAHERNRDPQHRHLREEETEGKKKKL